MMSSKETIVGKLYLEFQSVLLYLKEKGEISFLNSASDNFRKALLLAAASYFERCIVEDILTFVKEVSSDNQRLVKFVEIQALSKRFHTLFEWNQRNANTFFSLFGDSFKILMTEEVKNNENLAQSIKAFLELGEYRNRLVHTDFGTFTLEKTLEEIYQLYEDALPFVRCIPEKLRSSARM